MKKILLIIALVLITLSAYGQDYSSMNFNISISDTTAPKVYVIEKLTGNITVTEQTIFNKKTRTTLDVVKAMKVESNSETVYYIYVRFLGEDWRFMDNELAIATDSRVFEVDITSDYSDVIDGTYGVQVEETLFYMISSKDMRQLADTTSLRMQYYGSPVTIDPSKIALISSIL